MAREKLSPGKGIKIWWFTFRARYLSYRFAFTSWSERETINQLAGAKCKQRKRFLTLPLVNGIALW